MKTAAAVENFRLTAALSYAERGWQVVPLHHPMTNGNTGSVRCSCGMATCTSVGKHPRTMHGLLDATTDPEQIRAWWSDWPAANVGIRTGQVSGFVVIDIDPRNNGDKTVDELAKDGKHFPPTIEAETGGGGTHYLFIHPGGKVPSVSDRLPGIDVKGDGGYIVAPTSLHASGLRYTWAVEREPEEIDMAELPGWLRGLVVKKDEPRAVYIPLPNASTEGVPPAYWLKRALQEAGDGSRNKVGFWLACQLRDNNLSKKEAEEWVRAYQSRAPAGDGPYTLDEAMHSLDQAYNSPARKPSGGQREIRPPKLGNKPPKKEPEQVSKEPTPEEADGAAEELRRHMEDVIAGKVYNVPFPWTQLTQMAQALLPGSITIVCGDPGVGKTFLVLECLQFWLACGYEPAAFFIEKDRKFYSRRLLAQLEQDGRFVDFEWVKEHPEPVRAALSRHNLIIDEIGKCISSAPEERVTLDNLLAWIIQQAEAGKRIIIVDPITAVAAGHDRWSKDEDFVMNAQRVCMEKGASLILVTHSQKGNRPGPTTGHNMAGGAAYFRFADTTLWLQRPAKDRNVEYMTPTGATVGKFRLFFQMHKTRDGRGAGSELAYTFSGMRYTEAGLVLKDVRGRGLDDED